MDFSKAISVAQISQKYVKKFNLWMESRQIPIRATGDGWVYAEPGWEDDAERYCRKVEQVELLDSDDKTIQPITIKRISKQKRKKDHLANIRIQLKKIPGQIWISLLVTFFVFICWGVFTPRHSVTTDPPIVTPDLGTGERLKYELQNCGVLITDVSLEDSDFTVVFAPSVFRSSKESVYRDAATLLKAIHTSECQLSQIHVKGRGNLIDAFGNMKEREVFRLTMTQSNLDKINWALFDNSNLDYISEECWIHSAYERTD